MGNKFYRVGNLVVYLLLAAIGIRILTHVDFEGYYLVMEYDLSLTLYWIYLNVLQISQTLSLSIWYHLISTVSKLKQQISMKPPIYITIGISVFCAFVLCVFLLYGIITLDWNTAHGFLTIIYAVLLISNIVFIALYAPKIRKKVLYDKKLLRVFGFSSLTKRLIAILMVF